MFAFYNVSRQRSRVIERVAIQIDMIVIQNLLILFFVFLKKTLYGTFLAWQFLQAVLNFSHTLQLKNQIKISTGQQYLSICGSRSG